MHEMTRSLALFLSATVVTACSDSASTTDRGAPGATAARIVADALQAMGSDSVLERIESLELHGYRQEFLLSVAQDPAIPKVAAIEFVEQRDPRQLRAIRTNTFRLVTRPQPVPFRQRIAEGTANADAREELALAPERILLLAREAGDLRRLPDSVTSERRLRVVAFGRPEIRLYIDAETSLPVGWTGVRSYADDLGTWGVWGDVRTRVAWSSWSLAREGLRYPRVVYLWRNDQLVRVISYDDVIVNSGFPADSFSDLSADRVSYARARDTTLGNGIGEAVVIGSDDIVQIAGSFNVTLVHQPDGVVIFEAPHSAAYSRTILREVHRRWPGAAVIAVVVTSYMWPHLAGVREYVARGIPIYLSPRAARTVRAIAAAPFTQVPDSLARAPRETDLRVVADSARVGSIRILRLPQAGGEHGRGMLLAEIGRVGTGYLGDLYVPQRFEPNLWTFSLSEGLRALHEADILADTVLSLHNPPVSRADLERRLDEAISAR